MKSVTSVETSERLETTPIWRYMDFTRFVSMLSTSGLWFSKAGMFGDDPWEGFGKAKRFELPSDEAPKGAAAAERSLGQVMADLSQRSAQIVENARKPPLRQFLVFRIRVHGNVADLWVAGLRRSYTILPRAIPKGREV